LTTACQGINAATFSVVRPLGNVSMISLFRHALLLDALHVDERCLTADRDRLFDGSDAKFRADRRRHRSLQDDPFAFGRGESGERERDACIHPVADQRCGTDRSNP
jgi:hypothetical protein